MASLKKLFTEKSLSIEDLSYLNRLLKTNLSLKQSMDLLKNKKNAKIFEEITGQLDQGFLIENIMKDYLPAPIRACASTLLGHLSFNDALSISLRIYEEQQENRNGLFSSIAYPCILLFVTISALYLFDLYGIDTIFSLIVSFDADIRLYQDIRMVFRIVIRSVYYLILVGTLIVIYFIQPRHIVLLYLFLSEHFPNSLMSVYYSEEFMSLLLICIEHGYKTKEAISILKDMKNRPVISFLAFHLDESLMEGETMKEAVHKKYYDSSLSRFIKIGNYTNDFTQIISSYIRMAKQKIRQRMKRYTVTIQLSTYAFIGAIIVFIYQVLFMPMQAISMY
ncbi:MAG: type II secretion system F family protein [Erysipelotrichaceae bacterium]|nr:type II secretion system F family protein [Erysipelotrichaceae bacterium]